MRRTILGLVALALVGCSSAPTADPADVARTSTTPTPAATAPVVTEPPSSPPPAPEPTTQAPSPADTGGGAAVTIAEFRYAPDPVEVAAGGSVTWTNQDATAHTASITDGPDTGAIRGGAAATLTFDTPGTYAYVCQFHPGTMTGTVVVR